MRTVQRIPTNGPWNKKNWAVYAMLITAVDSGAGDVSYRASCYTKLNNDACAEERKKSEVIKNANAV